MDRKESDLIVEVTAENMPMAVGAIAEGLRNLRDDFGVLIRSQEKCEADNKLAHEEILGKIKRHDDYLIMFKISSCAWSVLKDKDSLKLLAILLAALGLDIFGRALAEGLGIK